MNNITPEGLPEAESKPVLLQYITGGDLMATRDDYFGNSPDEKPYDVAPGLNAVMVHYVKK